MYGVVDNDNSIISEQGMHDAMIDVDLIQLIL